jgi:DNA-binding ferritin-like protein
MKIAEKIIEEFMITKPQHQEEVNKLINESLWMVTQFHIWHLQTKSYAEHMAIGEFYEAIGEKLDSLAEHYIGTSGTFQVTESKALSNYSKAALKSTLIAYGESVNTVSTLIDNNNSLKVVLDEIEGCTAQTLYKLGLK